MHHKYKVGDKGLVRDGRTSYEVIMIDPSVEKPLIVKLTKDNGRSFYFQYRLDGCSLASGNKAMGDLMPPKEYVWVNWVRHPRLGVASVSFDTEEKAKMQTYPEWVPIKIAVKTEVPSCE